MRAMSLGALAILMLIVLITPRGAASADPCANPGPFKPAYPGGPIVGTNGDDVIRGTKYGEHILGYEGHDIICGMGGNDLLKGAQGNDRLYGGDGKDYLMGSYDDDELYGGRGNDKFDAGVNDHLENDLCNGGGGTDVEIQDGDCDTYVSIERQDAGS